MKPTDERKAELMAHLKYWCSEVPSEAGMRVADLLDRWQGLHHLDPKRMKEVEWTHTRFMVLKVDRRMRPGASLASFDFPDLTHLVFLAHDVCIRVQITPSSNRYLEIMFHPRELREGGMSLRHPSLETAVEDWRRNNAAPVAEAVEVGS